MMDPLRLLESLSASYCNFVNREYGIAFMIQNGQIVEVEKDQLEEVK